VFGFDPSPSWDMPTGERKICIGSSTRDLFDVSTHNTSGGLQRTCTGRKVETDMELAY